MKPKSVTERMKLVLAPKSLEIKARLFVARQDGITIYDSHQNETTRSISALVSGVWQASEALIELAHPGQDVMEFRLGFDTSSQGIYLFPFTFMDKRYFLGALYKECHNPGQLKRKVAQIREEIERPFQTQSPVVKKASSAKREGYLFSEISDEEIEHLFSVGGV